MAIVFSDERAHLLGGIIILVIHAGREQVSTEELTALGLRPEAVRTTEGGLLRQGRAARLLVAKAHAVEACQIAERLGRPDHVVGGDGRRHVGKLDFRDLCALLFQRGAGVRQALPHVRRNALVLHKRGDDTHAHAFDGVLQLCQEVRRHVLRRGVERVSPTRYQRVHGNRHVCDRAPEGPHLVEGRAKGHHAVAAHGPVGGLQAHHAAEARRLADGTAGV